jgi:hypothetical protein
MLKILDSIPAWKRMVELPGRIDALEERLAALEGAAPKRSGPTAVDCPLCGAPLKVIAERPHGDFGFAGMKVHSMRCTNPNCGLTTDRDWDPKLGYDAH